MSWFFSQTHASSGVRIRAPGIALAVFWPDKVWIVLILACTHWVGTAMGNIIPGAAVPWITYEAENMTSGGATLLGPQYGPNLVASEASGRKCMELNGTGQYVEFTAQAAADSMVVRYSVPDTANGSGADYNLSLYTNGVLAAVLPMTSRYSWLYGNYPFTNEPSAGSPRNFFDEVRATGFSIKTGDLIRLQMDAGDNAAWYDIDLVDLEIAGTPLPQPAGSLSVLAYGASTNGASDATASVQNCINAAVSKGVAAWLPPGQYLVSGTLNLPTGAIVQGAGMWFTRLVGNASVYNSNPSARVFVHGNGSNIHLADFSIQGFLNYRNDSEPNDGLGGSYGTGSTLSRIWVEHTKTGAWLTNSKGLIVDGCRFRDTIADGCNLAVGMESTIVTNCTARGTGDDCFPIWPATYTQQTYVPGFNLVTHCTGMLPFLANGGAIYGGISNSIQDCLFQDIPYGCGILASTTFPVGANTFSGITSILRCNLVRCGGYDPGYQWRAALQLCMDSYAGGIHGLVLGDVLITNSISDGMSIIGGNGVLSNAVAANVSIPNYGIGASGRNGLWVRNDATGGLSLMNNALAEYLNASSQFSLLFQSNSVAVTFQSSPPNLALNVDGTNGSSPRTFLWPAGTSHWLLASSPQQNSGTQYLWNGWSDGGGQSHLLTPSMSFTDTAAYATQYLLTMNPSIGGQVFPQSQWTNPGTVLYLSAVASNGYNFENWIGAGSGSYSGTNNPAQVAMNSPISETAYFLPWTPVQSLAFIQQPSTTAQGMVISPEILVEALDANSLPVSNAEINVVLGDSLGGLSGTLSRVTDQAGLAHFNDLTISVPGAHVLDAMDTVGSSVSAQSLPFIVLGPATALAFAAQPAGAVAGLAMTHQPVVQAVDALGHATSLNLPGNLVVQLALTNSSGLLLGSNAQDIGTNAGNGVAAFHNLAVNLAGFGNQLLAFTTNATGIALKPVLSQAFSVLSSPPPPSQLIPKVDLLNGMVFLTYATTPGFPYHVESSSNLAGNAWEILPGSITNAADATVTISFPQSHSQQQFYRTVSP